MKLHLFMFCNLSTSVHVEIQPRYCTLIADCSRSCPSGGTLDAECSQCLCPSDSVAGRVREKHSSLPLANVDIYTVGREWSPTAVSGSDGRFTISGICVWDLKLTARKDGYMIDEPEYLFNPGSNGIIVMLKLGAYDGMPGCPLYFNV